MYLTAVLIGYLTAILIGHLTAVLIGYCIVPADGKFF